MTNHKKVPPEWLGSFRLSCPPPIFVFIACALLAALELLWFGTTALFHNDWFTLPDDILLFRDGLLVCSAMLFGVYRVLWFHPLVYSDYLEWLKMTPWQKGVSLPLGPVKLCLWDAVILGGLMLLLMDGRIISLPSTPRLSPLAVVGSFLMGYIASLVVVAWLSDQRILAYIASALQAMTIGFAPWPIVSLCFLLASLAVAMMALSAGWEEFPWDDVREARKDWKRKFQSGSAKSGQLMTENDAPDKIPASELGWPFSVCSPVAEPVRLGQFERCQIASLIGIWCLNISQLNFHERVFLGGYGMLLFYVTGGLLATRLASTFSQHAPPISLAGRLATRQFIIPRYDAPIFASLGVLLVPCVMGMVSTWFFDWPLRWTGPVILTCTLWAHILIGPHADSWKLTAPCRLTAGTPNKRAFDQLT
ncbi:MAG: hypothetical protein ABJZ55_05190 [Fuerstiella sp.]